MRPMNPNRPSPRESGFSMIELVVVVGLIVIMAAMAIPNIAGFIRNYRIRGAVQQVAGEIQTARNKAISRNTNAGVVFRIMDSDSYRIWVTDNNDPAGLGPLRQLPPGVVFNVATGTQASGMAFDRLGRTCAFGSAGCIVGGTGPATTLMCPGTDLAQCQNRTPANTYVDVTGGTMTVTLREEATQNLRTVIVAPGGRVLTQR